MAVNRTITVAAGAFAPGHLGELTRIVPFELVDAVLDEARARERRVRLLPSRAGVYFVLAMCLFPQPGDPGSGGKLTAALDGMGLAVPSPKAALGVTGYPVIQLMTLVETGTRALIGAAFGAPANGQLAWARKLLHRAGSLDAGADGPRL